MVQQVGGIEPLLMGLVSQIGEREDAIVIDDLRGQFKLGFWWLQPDQPFLRLIICFVAEHIFGPVEFSRRDLGKGLLRIHDESYRYLVD